MTDSPSPATKGLRLEKMALLESHYEMNPDYAEKELHAPVCSATYTYQTQDGVLLCILAVKLTHGEKKAPFEMTVVYEAKYLYSPDIELDVEKFAKHVAPAHILPFVREEIAHASGHGMFPAYYLPPINIARLLKVQPTQSPSA